MVAGTVNETADVDVPPFLTVDVKLQLLSALSVSVYVPFEFALSSSVVFTDDGPLDVVDGFVTYGFVMTMLRVVVTLAVVRAVVRFVGAAVTLLVVAAVVGRAVVLLIVVITGARVVCSADTILKLNTA